LLKPRTLKILALLVAGYGLLVALGFVWPAYFDAFGAFLLLMPLLSVYAFHKLGVPGVLEHNGLCGWGWCSPTLFGGLFTGAFWLLAAWLLAWGLAALTDRFASRRE